MLVGMGVLGFVYNRPLTLVFINKMLLGFWPEWRLNLYWYILLAGIVLIIAVGKKSPYCEWFCPFGSAQECLGIIGGAKRRIPDRAHILLRWFQRVLALSAIALALLSRNSSISSYEVFGAFFHLIGSSFNFALLGVVLIATLFLKRPWCSYLCPLRPVSDFIRLISNWIREIWLKSRPKTV
jgi:polyferredoxin